MSFSIFIPARYGSERLPGKLLLKIKNKTLLQYAYENALRANPNKIIIAVDHELLADLAVKLGAEVVLTPPECANGTERIATAILDPKNNFNYQNNDVIVNLQADEILMPGEYIELVANNLLANTDASIATLAKPIINLDVLLNPNIVKVIKNHKNFAMYFSRAAIPFIRDDFNAANFSKYQYWQHIGLYSYRVGFLKQYHGLIPSEFELAEKLEQLRALFNGYNIHVGEAGDFSTCDINTQEDYEKACLNPELGEGLTPS